MSDDVFFLRKKKAPEVKDEAPLVSDEGTWHEWDSAGRRLLSAGEVVRGVEHLCQAVDRFDSTPAEMGRFLERVSDSLIPWAKLAASKERALPTYLLANIDAEIRVKFPDMVVPCVLTDIFADACDAEISRCQGPGDVVMLATDALYSCLGYVLHSVDVREDIIRCARASEICCSARDLVKGMKKGSGHTLPRDAMVFLDIYARFAESIKSEFRTAVSGVSDADLDRLVAHRTEHPVDLVPYIFEGLDAANHTAVKGTLSKKKYERQWEENVKLLVDHKMSFEA